MSKKLKTQLENPDDIKAVLKKVQVKLHLQDGRDVETFLIYLPVSHDNGAYDDFFELLKSGILQNFVFSCSHIEKELGLAYSGERKQLFDKAVRKLSKHTAKGELGELLLFTILDVYLEAPKLLSKISMKTSRRMPAFGADAVHGQFFEDTLRLYLGESKLHKKYNSAANDAVKSIESASNKYIDEFDLLDVHLDFPDIDSESEQLLLALLNPFEKDKSGYELHSPCFIGFSSSDAMKAEEAEEDYEDRYVEFAKPHMEHFFSKIDDSSIEINETTLLLLPFACVDDLVDQFIEFLGIKD